jgi:Mechanosensitive ion channel, conserved TM helix
MHQFKNGLGDAWASVATFLPKLIGFLLILIVGYFIARLLAKVIDGILERVGFDRMVEKGGVGRALASTRYDASDIVGKLVFYTLFLFVLQLAFGVFGPNPVSDLIKGVIAYLPNLLVAIIIIVIGAAIAAAVKDIVSAALGALSYGRTLAMIASSAILVVAVFAALDQLLIAPAIVTGLFYALLAIVVGSSIVSIGGGGIKTMSRYWERAAQRAEVESSSIKQQAQGSGARIAQRVEQRTAQIQEPSPTRPSAGV